MSCRLIKEKYDFIKSRPYKNSNYEGLDIYYDKNTFIKLHKNHNITLSTGAMYLIIKKSYGLKEGIFSINKDTQLYNDTNSNLYCVLTDCIVSKEENSNKMYVKNGYSEKELL